MTQIEILTKTKEAVDNGHGQEIINLIDKLKSKTSLPEALQEVIEKAPNNPIDGKDYYDKLLSFEDPADKIDLVDELLEDPDQYDAKQLAQFIYEFEDHIISFKDGENLKKTEKTKDAKMLSRKGYKEMKKILFKNGKMNMSPEVQSQAMEYGLKQSGIDQRTLTQWEKDLVGLMMYESYFDIWKHSVGKQ